MISTLRASAAKRSSLKCAASCAGVVCVGRSGLPSVLFLVDVYGVGAVTAFSGWVITCGGSSSELSV